ncbi:hypothetical protein PR003_g18636 [Phytophthora rubi]|uniref:Uncharacterized protein n=1 Tax=Phytophthora rubi TaxID=129364 RepID=A0A6A4E5P3_9STRA|nr:hypothetical protein PR003_g18636 [Phytophthora rubi]
MSPAPIASTLPWKLQWNSLHLRLVAHPKFLEWFPDTEEIHISEFVDTPHENYVAE